MKEKVKYTENDEIVKEMIDKVDKRKVKKILSSSFMMTAKDLLGVDKMIEDWAKAKRDIYLILGKNLRVSKEVEYDATESDWDERLNNLYRKYPGCYMLMSNFRIDDFKNNTYRTFSRNFENAYMTQAKEGMKLTTFLSQAFKNPEFDTDFSKIIDETKIHGVATISIDPIDYLLMSLNTSGWKSCHSIHEHNGKSFGCYVGGLFSYMCDESTLIAYRHSKEMSEYIVNKNKFKEYSKNWRQCIYIDTRNGNFVTSRQYPRTDEVIAKNIREMLEDIVSSYFEYDNNWKINRDNDVITNYMRNYDIEDKDDWDDGDGSNALHYNDIWYGYSGAMAYNKNIDYTDTDILVGSVPICPICGEKHIEDHSHPSCEDCYYSRLY